MKKIEELLEFGNNSGGYRYTPKEVSKLAGVGAQAVREARKIKSHKLEMIAGYKRVAEYLKTCNVVSVTGTKEQIMQSVDGLMSSDTDIYELAIMKG